MPTMKTLVTVLFLLATNAFLCRGSSYSYSPLIRSDLGRNPTDEQPLSKIAIHNAFVDLHESASVKAEPLLLGLKLNKHHRHTIRTTR
ncbi:putative phosphodiesterase I [Helianthus annuus]|nr:putative phosphodiesterase I [Helianthus annuus]